MQKILATIAGVAAMAASVSAFADVYYFSYTGGGFNGDGFITTSGSGDPQTMTALTGTFDGLTISGLAPPGSCCTTPPNDNLLYPNDDAPMGPSYVDYEGFAFGLVGTSLIYNLFYYNPYAIIGSDYSLDAYGGTFILTAVPEPVSWVLMMIGFGGIGMAQRSRRRAATAA